MNTDDRRVKRTKKMIRESFFELLSEKNINEISIRELSDRADINRGTFYAHYEDIYALLSELESEMINEIGEMLEKHSPDELKKDILPLIKDIFGYVENNKKVFASFFECERNLEFTQQVLEIIKEKCFYDWDAIYNNPKKANYELYYAYIWSGCIGLIRYWLYNSNESVDEISQIARDLIFSGVNVIK